jgi:hypothetical protein
MLSPATKLPPDPSSLHIIMMSPRPNLPSLIKNEALDNLLPFSAGADETVSVAVEEPSYILKIWAPFGEVRYSC